MSCAPAGMVRENPPCLPLPCVPRPLTAFFETEVVHHVEFVSFRIGAEDLLHLAACALFGGVAAHLPSMSLTSETAHRAVAAVLSGLHCSVPAIQLPAAVAAGVVLQKFQNIDSAIVASVAEAVGQARAALDGGGPGFVAAWQPASGGGSSRGFQQRKVRSADVLEVLKLCEDVCVSLTHEM